MNELFQKMTCLFCEQNDSLVTGLEKFHCLPFNSIPIPRLNVVVCVDGKSRTRHQTVVAPTRVMHGRSRPSRMITTHRL
uniref:Uncharacterized protein n=1 Tax=Anguilla anguilla TaxID=7936 RepID=A0A0E9WVP0_ANGAN